MIEVILAVTSNGGIGFKNKLPWEPIKDELSIFRIKTMDALLIAGRITADHLPSSVSEGRKLIKVTRGYPLENALKDALAESAKKIFVIGGGTIYSQIFSKHRHLISKVHMSIIQDQAYTCDTFVSLDEVLNNFVVDQIQNFQNFQHQELVPKTVGAELQYLNLLSIAKTNGIMNKGRNGFVQSIFGHNLKIDLRNGFPLITTKKMFFRGVVEELIFFLKGETDSTILEKKGVNIWKGNTSRNFLDSVGLSNYPEGCMGPMYGYQWRHFGRDFREKQKFNEGKDQLMYVVNTIKTDPKSRRIIMTTFNPLQVDEGVLYPCHSLMIQFFVEEGHLDMFCYNRSSDLLLGLPFNIASSSLLLTIIAKMTGLTPRFLNLSLGDCHIYDQHMESVSEQLLRVPFPLPSVMICKPFEFVEELTFEHFELKNYESHPPIKAPMIS